MPDNQYGWLILFKKIREFISFVISFFRTRNNEEDQRRRDKIDTQIKEGYKTIDREKDKQRDNDLDKRLKNLF